MRELNLKILQGLARYKNSVANPYKSLFLISQLSMGTLRMYLFITMRMPLRMGQLKNIWHTK